MKDNTINYLNGNGELISNVWFENVESWQTTEGYLPVKYDGKWGIINHYGRYVVPLKFDSIEEVYDSDMEGYIATQGDKKYFIDYELNFSEYDEN